VDHAISAQKLVNTKSENDLGKLFAGNELSLPLPTRLTPMAKVNFMARKLLQLDVATGTELVARMIDNHSPRCESL
jgi:hypothetical protein